MYRKEIVYDYETRDYAMYLDKEREMYRKEIVYDRETRDYAMYLDGELVGFARTHHEAEVTLDQLVFELLHCTLRPKGEPEVTQYEWAECAICYALQPCFDDGEALICQNRAACQQRSKMQATTELTECASPLDEPGIGRKLDHLMHTDRHLLIDILSGTHRLLWPMLAHAYLAALGIDTEESRVPIIPGVIYVWSQIVKEQTAHGT